MLANPVPYPIHVGRLNGCKGSRNLDCRCGLLGLPLPRVPHGMPFIGMSGYLYSGRMLRAAEWPSNAYDSGLEALCGGRWDEVLASYSDRENDTRCAHPHPHSC